MASVADMSCAVLYFPLTGEVLLRAWCPRATADKIGNTPYRAWEKMGLLHISKGVATDPSLLYDAVAKDCETFNVQAIGYDRYRMEDAKQEFEKRDIDPDLVRKVGMGYFSMSPAIDRFERLVLQAKIKHNNNPILTWQLSNVRIDTDAAGNQKPSKKRSIDKIDAIVALLVAVYCSSAVQEQRDPDLSNLLFTL